MVLGGHCRWQVAAGGDRTWPQYVQCGCAGRGSVALTAHRESSPSIPPLQLPGSWILHGVALGLWSVVKTLDASLSVSQKS